MQFGSTLVIRMTSDNDNASRSTAGEPATAEQHQEHRWTIAGKRLADLLRATQEPFLRTLELRQLSKDYLRQSRFIIDEYATFCDGEEAANPWLWRQKYLAHRADLRSPHRFSASYLANDGRQLRYFLRWYLGQVARGEVCLGELSAEQLQTYWSTQQEALPYRRRVLSKHLRALLQWLRQRPVAPPNSELQPLLHDYFEQRRLAMRGEGYGFVLTHRAQIATRRLLTWLEQQGHLTAGTAAQAKGALWAGAATVAGASGTTATECGKNEADSLLHHFVLRVDPKLPQLLRQPLIEYLAHLVHERQLVKHSLQSILRASLALCRTLAAAGGETFAHLRVRHLDQVVASLVSAPQHDLLRRRQQVQALHSRLRGFLRYLHRRGLVDRDLAPVLISPPCYRASRPPTVLSPPEVHCLLESVDRQRPGGRRSYAILLLLTTYGLRPVDVSRLRLDDLQWREQRLALVQKKTGQVVVLPLLPEVAAAIYDYLRHDRALELLDRRVFVSLNWPHRPVCARTICDIVVLAMQEASLSGGRTRHLRTSVATHLLRQGEAFSTIQEVLGHRTAETTQRYAVTDVELLRQVIEETER